MDHAQLGEALDNLDKGAGDARLWIDELKAASATVAQQSDSLTEAARRARLAARRLSHAAKRNNCVGVFGPSQAGKSYLVSTLARPREAAARLGIRLGDEIKDFLRDINPPGDRESTGLVTRFTVNPGEVDPAYPVDIRLLTETDLVKILANSFFLDFDPNAMSIEPVEEEDARAALRAAEGAQGEGAVHLDEIALFDLTQYFRQNFKSRIGAFDRADFWSGLIRLGGGLKLADRAQLFSLFWGRIPEFTELFVHLVSALDQIDHAPDARAAIQGLIPRETSIIDVAILKQLRSEKDAADLVPVKPMRNGKAEAETALPRATLTALIAEVRLVIDVKPWPFFDHTDLLDFPGARSRLKLLNLPSDPEDKDVQVRELFLRGKIAYLFQRYTDELELTSMLLCMPPSNAEVKDLAGMVKGWIAATHGATPERRKVVRNALFLVLTKHDMEFAEKDGETRESRLGKWDRRLHASLLELYGKDGWPEDWDGKPFNNTFFLRNPGMKQIHLMAYNDIETLDEQGPVDGEAFRDFREGFMTSEDVGRHFADRQAVWDAALAPNDGGVTYLVENIVAALDPNLKRKQASERLVEAAAALHQPLKGLYYAEGDEARREKDMALVQLRKDLHGALRVNELRGFCHLQRALMLDPAAIRGTFLNVASMRDDELEPSDVAEDAADDPFDDDPWADTPAPTAVTEKPRRRERPEVFAERIVNLWAGQMRAFQQDDAALTALGLPAEVVGQIVDELLVGSSREGLAERISDDVRLETQGAGTRWVDVSDRVAGLTSMHLNDFVAFLGYAAREPNDRPGFPEAPKDRTRAIFSLDALSQPGMDLGETREQIERAAFIDWGVAFRDFGNANVGHSAGRDISDEQNARLGEILNLVDLGAPGE